MSKKIRFKEKITQIRRKTLKFFKDNIPEIIFTSGIGIICYTTFTINKIAGLYVLGGMATVIGFILARMPTNKD